MQNSQQYQEHLQKGKDINIDVTTLPNLTIEDLEAMSGEESHLSIIRNPNTKLVQTVNGKFYDSTIQTAEDAVTALMSLRGLYEIPDDTIFRFTGTDVDIDGNAIYQLQQTLDGLLVGDEPFELAVDIEGNPIYITGDYIPISDIDTTPTISVDEAKSILNTELELGEYVKSTNLIIYKSVSGEYYLAWELLVNSTSFERPSRYLVDAHTGEDLAAYVY